MSNNENKTVYVVTGSTGIIGKHLVNALSEDSSNEVLAVSLNNANNDFFSELDNVTLVDWQTVTDYKADVMIHLAWENADRSLSPKEAQIIETGNVQLTSKAVDLAADLECKRFIGVGHISEFAKDQDLALSSNDLKMDFGAAKLLSRGAVKSKSRKREIEYIWVRLPHVYGDVSQRQESLVQELMYSMIISEDDLVFNQSLQYEDFVHVDDVVKGLSLVAEKGVSGEDYYLGSGSPKQMYLFVEEAADVIGFDKKKITFGPAPYLGVVIPVERYSIESLSKDTGYDPQVNFIDGITKLAKDTKVFFKKS